MRILFKNGTIYDGTGAKPYAGSVLIEDDRIVAVGDAPEEGADPLYLHLPLGFSLCLFTSSSLLAPLCLTRFPLIVKS